MRNTAANLPLILAVDPGKQGALAALWPDGQAQAWYTPVIRNREPNKKRGQVQRTPGGNISYKVETHYDLWGIVNLLRQFRRWHDAGGAVHILIERQGPRPDDGPSRVLTIGRGLGFWEMGFAMARLTLGHGGAEYGESGEIADEGQINWPIPRYWKLRCVPEHSPKSVSREVASKIFPTIDFSLVKSEALAEALLLADFHRRRLQGQPFLRLPTPVPKRARGTKHPQAHVRPSRYRPRDDPNPPSEGHFYE